MDGWEMDTVAHVARSTAWTLTWIAHDSPLKEELASMITVHHLGVSQSERVVWLCEELAIPYTLNRYDRDPTTRMAPAEYKALHPMGIAPVITDGDVVLAESGAILEYIMARYGSGNLSVGSDRSNFADYLFWFHFANGTVMPSEMGSMIANFLGLKEGNPIIAMLKARSERAFLLVEKRLEAAAYFAGNDFTAADIMMLFPLTTMRAFVQKEPHGIPQYQGVSQAHRRAPRLSARDAKRRSGNVAEIGLTLETQRECLL
jgi:glutathione S-transferase